MAINSTTEGHSSLTNRVILITSQHTLPHDPGRLLPLVRGDVGEVDGDVDDGLVEAQLVQRVADDLAVAAQQEPHRDGHLAVGGVVLSEGGHQGCYVPDDRTY